jgi:long-chain acyl-CoA synthetase
METVTETHSVVDIVRHVRQNYSNPKALNYRDKNTWHHLSTETFLSHVRQLTLGLVAVGIKKGDRIGIFAFPSPNWTIADIAIMISGGIIVPLFANISEENFVYETKQTESKIIFVDGVDQWNVFRRYKDSFRLGIALGETPDDSGVISFEDVLKAGADLDQKQPNLYEQLENAIHPDDIGAIIYTSGSTGIPKGVELTQENLSCIGHYNNFRWDATSDRYLSLLPLAHVFGHCVNMWLIHWGVSVYYSNDYKNLGEICREMMPTVLIVVPRLLEKIYVKILEKVQKASFFKRKIALWALNLAKMEQPPSLYKTLVHPIANALVYSKFRKAFGGHMRIIISGGAPLNPSLHHFFQEIGIFIYQGWGLTEACPICVNMPGKNKIGTVGQIIGPQELTISPEGEVLVKSPLVMKGYYFDREATDQVIDEKGYLHTGDKGSIDEEGYLTILGRIKELYKTSTGEYVAPVPIEQALCRCPLIDMAMVIAEGRKFTSCLLFPNFEFVEYLKTQNGQKHLTNEEFLKGSFVRQEIEKFLNEINSHLNHWEQIHDYRFIMKPLTIEDGDLTPSLKIRREIVTKKYNHVINSIYQEEVA